MPGPLKHVACCTTPPSSALSVILQILLSRLCSVIVLTVSALRFGRSLNIDDAGSCAENQRFKLQEQEVNIKDVK